MSRGLACEALAHRLSAAVIDSVPKGTNDDLCFTAGIKKALVPAPTGISPTPAAEQKQDKKNDQ
jgi:hypothetical protein